MSLPYFPLYPTDFEADTSHLTLEEDGAFNRLLRIMWMTPGCSLPDDDRWIMRRMRVDQPTYDRVVLVVIDEFLVRKSGRIFSPRLSKEWQKTDLAHRKRVEAGKQGGAAKHKKTNKKATSKAIAKPKQPEPEPEPYKVNTSFDDFWDVYPSKVGKGQARKAWGAAIRKSDPVLIIEAVKRHASTWAGKEKQFIPHPSTWLDGERWDDDLSPTLKTVGGTDVDRDAVAVNAIKSGKPFLCTQIARHRAERLVHEGRVTEDEAKAVGVI